MAPLTSPPSEAARGGAGTAAAPAGGDAAGLGRGRAAAFVAPALVLVAVFLVFPALWTLYLGTTDYRLTGLAASRPKFVGVQNYGDVLGDGDFHHSLWLTLQFVLGSAVIGQTLLGFAIAWVMRDRTGFVRRVVEALVLLAWILPGSVIAFLWIALLDRDGGTLNALLGTPGTAWLIDHPMACVIVFNVWHGTAFSMMLYGAALGNVPPSHLETARLAGASTFQTLRDAVLPRIRGHVLTSLLLISLWTFNDFTPFLITAGGPDRRSEIMSVYVYRTALGDGRLGFGAAISLIMILINLVIALVYLRALRERGRRASRQAVAA
ncbi:carbohydrate ABC transporter permease [Actinomadura verrucosospora]|uniref:Binding-protein-dependent transporter inner membrane component n=1 Tax=Actinomadura verrucosospora TaxID=46165 RepID=A0A7D3VQ80_ACTVE|nr:sugar ABC transporter permease [Actinomadura verrucosospora]QKG20200.1 binding-protein-dependent transporter inner membrane component [Actinomadura verrucosospora]